jgi:serine/threonine protein kinase
MSALIGQSLGRYQILEQLCEGGMATVYKAYDSTLDRFVAIKVIRTDQFAPSILDEILKRFEREAKALAKLSHPNIVHVHDYGNYEGAPYLVMEYLPSGALKERSGDPVSEQQALRILLPIAQALAYVHEHNIIHRDIKPANILLTEKGLPMLSDFGIAKLLENNEGASLTGAGMTIGTPEYMAPEQWTGQSGPQSDIYSLGVVLYELVTGRKPYTADTPIGIMLKQAKEPLPPPSQFVPDLPKELENVILKALEKQPENRYKSMNDFAADLETLAGEQTLFAGMKPESIRMGAQLVAAGGTGEKTVPVSRGSTPPGGPTHENPSPPAEHPKRSIKWRLWIPVVGSVVVLLCIGLILARGLVISGLNGLFPFIAASAQTPPTAGVKVLWDISNGPGTSANGSVYTPDGMYKSLAQALHKENFIISSADLTNLNSYSILVLSESPDNKMTYTSSEVAEIEQFVRVSGHGLLIMSDIPAYENLLDSVSSRFSIGLGELTSNGPASYSNNPFFSGVTSVQFLSGGGVLQVSPPGQSAASDKNGNTVIAFCQCDAGRVMVICDTNLWDNQGLNQADNLRFATNVFQWLAKSSP